MKKMRRNFIVVLLILGLVLVACGGGDEEEQPQATEEAPAATEAPQEAEPTDEPAPTDTPEPEPTATEAPLPTATADPLAGFTEFDSDAIGVTFMLPSDWVVESDDTGLEIQTATSQEMIDNAGSVEGATFNVIRLDKELLALFGEDLDVTDPISILNVFTQLAFAQEDNDFTFTSEPTATTVNGLDAAVITVEATDDESGIVGFGNFYAILGDPEVTIVLSIVSEGERDALQPTLDAMLGSLSLRPAEAGEVVDVPETPADLPESQGFLLYGDSVDGTVAADEVVVWDFIGLEGETIDITIEPDENLDIVLNVLDASGNSILDGEVDDSFGTETITDLALTATGDFYVTITGFGGSAGNYTLTIAEAGASAAGIFESEGIVSYGDVVHSNVPADGQAAWTFRAFAGDVVNIVVTPLDDSLDAVVDVLDSSGNSILPSGEVDDSFGEEQVLAQVITSDGEYVVVVRGFAGATGNFDLSLNNATGGVLPTGNAIAYGDFATGSITGSETATYTFFGNENELIDVTANPINDEFDLTLDILDSNGRSILPDGELDVSFDAEFVRALRLPASGAYAITVHGYDSSTGDFEVNLDLTNGGEYDNVLYTYYTIDEEDEEHSFPFTSAAGDQVTIVVKPVGVDFDVVVDIYDDATDEVLDSVDLTTGFEELVFVAPAAGDYYFVVRGFEGSVGDYDVIMVAPETTLLVLADGDTIEGLFDETSTMEYWYGGSTGETIMITLETDAEIDGVIRILDQDDNVLAEIDDAFFGEDEQLSYTFENDDFVIIEITDFFEGKGQFTLLVDAE
jgi:hypothetical protein